MTGRDVTRMFDALASVNERLTYTVDRASHRDRHETAAMWAWGKPSPTTPPSKAVQFQGGWFWDADAGDGWWSEAVLGDLDTGGNCEVSAFASAGYFRAILIYHTYQDVVSTESAECASAVDAIDAGISAGMAAQYDQKIPLVMVIVKNDGTTGETGAILPVDGANRGRSFIYRRIRTWLHHHKASGGGPT